MEQIQVEQAEWGDISLVSYGRQGGCVASIRRAAKPLPGTSQERERTVKVDFVLLRSVTRHTWTLDSRNLYVSPPGGRAGFGAGSPWCFN